MNLRQGFNTIPELIEDIKNGRMVILVDDEDRENEGDLVLAADHATPEMINFMALEARGLICLALSAKQIDQLQLPLMVRDEQNYSPNKTAFTVSIEAAWGVSTGISAADRAHTVKVASHPNAKPSDLHMPGHIFPIKAQSGGVLKRAGHTEGSVDLAKLAGLNPAAVICEVMNPDGTMARVKDLKAFAVKHGIKIGTIVDLIEFRLMQDHLIEELMNVALPNVGSDFRVRVFKSKVDGTEHLVLQKGDIKKDEVTTVRVHADSSLKDLLGALISKTQDDKSFSSQSALEVIRNSPQGVFLLLRTNSQSHSLVHEIKAWCGESSAPEMDARDYGIGAQILRAVGAHKIKLITNKLDRRVGLKAYGLEIVERISAHENADIISEENNGKSEGQEQNEERQQKPESENRCSDLPIQ